MASQEGAVAGIAELVPAQFLPSGIVILHSPADPA